MPVALCCLKKLYIHPLVFIWVCTKWLDLLSTDIMVEFPLTSYSVLQNTLLQLEE